MRMRGVSHTLTSCPFFRDHLTVSGQHEQAGGEQAVVDPARESHQAGRLGKLVAVAVELGRDGIRSLTGQPRGVSPSLPVGKLSLEERIS